MTNPDNINLDKALSRMKKYAKNNPVKALSPSELEARKDIESGLLAGNPTNQKTSKK